MIRRICFPVLLALLAGAGKVAAQNTEELMRVADSAATALAPAEALKHYDKVILSDSSHFEALWKASMNAIDLGEFEKDKKAREALYRKGAVLARRAVGVNPRSADAHFHLARALGMAALAVGAREKVDYAREIREHALMTLKEDSTHAGALHVMGVWNAEVMRLSLPEKLVAKTFLGAGFFSQASWADAIMYMERSVAVDPSRLTHHLDLARIYRDRKMTDKAKEAYQRVIDGKSIYFNDNAYKAAAAAERARLK